MGWLGVGSGWRHCIEEPQGWGSAKWQFLAEILKIDQIPWVEVENLNDRRWTSISFEGGNINDYWKAKLGRRQSWAAKNISWTLLSRSWRWRCMSLKNPRKYKVNTYNTLIANDMGNLQISLCSIAKAKTTESSLTPLTPDQRSSKDKGGDVQPKLPRTWHIYIFMVTKCVCKKISCCVQNICAHTCMRIDLHTYVRTYLPSQLRWQGTFLDLAGQKH